MRIAVDAAGGDRAPIEISKGALSAAQKYPEVGIVLVGPEAVIRGHLEEADTTAGNIEVCNAPQAVDMHESPMVALRSKPFSSIAVAVKLMADGETDAFVSAGNTGAVVAASSLMLKKVKGVRRPGIAVPMEAINHMCVGIDMGANIQCKPEHLAQYAIMASIFGYYVWNVKDPRVGLLNIGVEESKGTKLVRESHRLISKTDLNFIGNVEGTQLFLGVCDVFVCEGFVGNILLKASEGLMEATLSKFREMADSDPETRQGFKMCKPAFDSLRSMGDFAEYGGAPLLGIDGAVIICHGRSDAKAIENAIKEAKRFVELDVNVAMREALVTKRLPD